MGDRNHFFYVEHLLKWSRIKLKGKLCFVYTEVVRIPQGCCAALSNTQVLTHPKANAAKAQVIDAIDHLQM